MAVPPRPARKMAVLSVGPPAPWAPGQIAAGRAHRPGSRRLGGVEAPGASPATGASWPDRRKGWASPGQGPVLPFTRGGCVDPGSGRGHGACLNSVPGAGACSVNHTRALRVQPGFFSQARTGLPLPELVVTGPGTAMHQRHLPPSRPGVGISARVLLPTALARSDCGGLRPPKAARS